MAEANQTPIQVKPTQLPLCCPPKGARIWSEHPRVFLSLKKTGKATCPYCGARYVLEN
ncbi:MAG TPA: zinc-finger domain-containing protein [Sedimenticola sp.]|nr:zinc-finger domain-containing protein [Sedimenticola sp.]